MAASVGAAAVEPKKTLVIEGGHVGRQYWSDLWRYRELLGLLAMRDVLVRYKQTVFGVAWSVLRPLFTMIVFSLVFGKIAHLDSRGAPYPLFTLAGVLPWQFFSSALGDCSNSLTANAQMLSKVYFPRLIVPIASVLVSTVDFLVSLSILLVAVVYYHFSPAHYDLTWRILFVPVFLLMGFLAALGPGLWFSALNVKYRDFRYIVPVILQFGIYASPVGYGSYTITGKLHILSYLNPMFAVIDGFRWCILGARQGLYATGMAISLCVIAAFCAIGMSYFRKSEQQFADVI
jgi:lipopolysaccharide transport system permease protein